MVRNIVSQETLSLECEMARSFRLTLSFQFTRNAALLCTLCWSQVRKASTKLQWTAQWHLQYLVDHTSWWTIVSYIK